MMTWLNLEDIMLSDINQKEKILHGFTYMYNLKNKQKSNTELIKWWTLGRVKSGGGNVKMYVKRYTLCSMDKLEL